MPDYLDIARRVRDSIELAEPATVDVGGPYWPESCEESMRRFGQPHAFLFPMIGKRVMSPFGTGKLEQVFAGRCTVTLDDGRQVVVRPDGITLIP